MLICDRGKYNHFQYHFLMANIIEQLAYFLQLTGNVTGFLLAGKMVSLSPGIEKNEKYTESLVVFIIIVNMVLYSPCLINLLFICEYCVNFMNKLAQELFVLSNLYQCERGPSKLF